MEAAISHFIQSTQIEHCGALDQFTASVAEQLPKSSVDLLAALYGDTARGHTILLVDASLRTQVTGVFDLDVVDIPAVCLFDGESAEKFGEVAPWLVDISITDPETQDLSFHRDFFERHWSAGTSVIVRSGANIDRLRQHLRHFTKLPVIDDGKSRFFRFWDGRVLPDFLRAISTEPDRARRMMMTDEGLPLNYIVPDRQGAVSLFYPDEDGLRERNLTAMFLRWSDFASISTAKRSEKVDQMTQRIAEDFEVELNGQPIDSIRQTVLEAVKRFEGFGFYAYAHLHFFATWSVLYGTEFEQNDTTGRLQAICRSTELETERFRAFRNWFDSFKLET